MKPFVPVELPIDDYINPLEFYDELISANTNVGKYEVMLKKSKINKDFLITPLSLQEAVQSTKIEGTQITFDEVLEFDIDKKEKNDDAQEVLNYYEALQYGKRALSRLPISTRMFKELHQILLSGGVRGESRAPGEYRSIQNFIGPEGCTMKTATFVPPEPQLVDDCMSNLEKYINEPNDDLHPLVRIAIIHAQFETIHPFLDGNGRIGRILIPLYLYDVSLIDFPNLFISETLEKDKYKYYRLLNGTRKKENWDEWIKFFLESINKQALKNINNIEEIDKLYEKDLEKTMDLINSTNVVDLIKSMFQRPIFNVKMISSLAGIPDSTCRRYLSILEEEQIIYSDNKMRNRKYYYYNLLDLLR
ncbi:MULTISPECIES: Fic family protein [unclassified Candidatus Frackibacter]|uniref:Fic family protein n=1 Tax=unclassified Candidatus Frackibacter TaxID=2648818 RepID=UPI000887DCC7|nr:MULTISPECIES: Fic family protein [unclassified Candidatus Frackibacter]SDC42184.1 Fic family protein [Candidatus Frackibacter sp. WG11]SEM58925.1 Fic family protein [Candidatus Frackibacter sp. WG12]SFL63208.1 Fic family protein [Candidatus Frackibacter sp. WG13]